ncbi:MAG TPA: beta-galactosidase [Anaerolineae bacterium]|jgi:beta-galactosidase
MSSTPTERPWPTSRFPGFLFGGDYNPEQWTPQMGYDDETIWRDDMRLMRLAGVNVALVGIFSWTALQPDEQTFTFDWLDRVLALLAEHNILACLGTGTAAQPAWLSAAHPDILPVNEWSQRRRHGGRMNFCPTSPTFRYFAHNLVRRLAERYGQHPALLMWHVSNEYGPVCYCDHCAARFRTWLQARYGSLEVINRRWVTPFWSHTLTTWEQIEPPGRLGEHSIQGLMLDYAQFMSEMNLECFQEEAAILRAITPDVPVTTNSHGLVKHLDYFAWAAHQDIIAWDSYPPASASPAWTAFRFDLMRGLKGGQSWLLMEQTPSQVQWQPYNPLKRPGEMRLQSYQAIAHGADSVLFFQWRQSRGSQEMHHGAIVSHAAHEQTRVFKEVAALGAELHGLGQQILDARTPARVALMFSWPNWWAVEYKPGLSAALDYPAEVLHYYSALWRANIPVDIISPDSPLEGYDLVIAPLLYMVSKSQGAAIEHYVAGGGLFLATYFSGIVANDGRAWLGGYPGPLRRTLGLWVEEVDPLEPGRDNCLVVADGERLAAGTYPCDLWAEVLHLEGAQALAYFGHDFYAGQPAVTEYSFGQGRAYYVATRPEPPFLDRLLGLILVELNIAAPLTTPTDVEVTRRCAGEQTFLFVLNHAPTEQVIDLLEPMRDLLTGQVSERQLSLTGRGVAILVPTSANETAG